MATAISLIDLETWFGGTPDQRRTPAATVDAHLQRLGFVVVDHRLPVGPGLESNAATYGVQTAPDQKETYAYGPVDVPDDSLRTADARWHAPDVWPADLSAAEMDALVVGS